MKIEQITEKWSQKYKRSIDCSNPKGFSQKAHCAGRKKKTNEAPQGFASMNLDANKVQQSIDYFYTDHAPNNIGGRKEEGSFKGFKIVSFTKAPDTLMFLVDNNDKAVFYVAYSKLKDGVAVGNVRSNGTVKATEVYAMLVDKFGKLYSDLKQTPQGAKIWTSLAKFYPNLAIKDTGDRLVATKKKNESIYENNANDKVMELLLDNIGAGPFDGGCVIVAQALQIIHGGEIMALVRPDGIADHAVVQKGNTMYDFDGPGTPEEVISRFEKNEGARITDVRKLRMTDLTDAPRNTKLAKQIATIIQEINVTESKEIRTQKRKDGFTIDLYVDNKHVGQYTHTRDDDIVRNFVEIFPEYRNKGYGTMLLLAAIKTADDMDMDFEEDTQSLTPAMSRLYDELSDSGLIYGGGGAWTVSPSGENELEDWLLEVTENFADGKVKGKSRPGRVKRAGASCKGSVTDLRAKAKKASGERAKMYHWCANMKSGRKKK